MSQIDMGGWRTISILPMDDAGEAPVALTREQVRELLEEGRRARAEHERRIALLEATVPRRFIPRSETAR